MAGEHSNHLGHDDDSTGADDATAGRRHPCERWCTHQEGKRVQAHARPPCTKQEPAQEQNEVVSGQAAATARPHEPSLGAERILIIDLASTQARAKGVAPTASCEEGHTEAAAARPPKASPPPTANEVDNRYNQLVEIHAIAAMQLAECARWRQSNPTTNAAHTSVCW
jgi:hypothetical protein